MALSFSRRSFFYLAVLVLASIILFRWRTTLKNLLFRPTTRAQPRPQWTNPFVEGPKTLVGLAHGNDIDATVAKAIELIGGIERLGVRNQTVLLKPNVVSAEPSPATTSPKVVSSVIKLLYQAGARKVYVGDMSALLTLPTERNMEKTGLLDVIREGGAEPVFFENHEWVKVAIPQGQRVQEVHVSEWIYKVDRVVNLPVIKTHRNATYSICLKNFIGATHGRERPYLIDSSHWEEIVAELNLAYQPHLNIIDGTLAMVSGGPWSGDVEKPGMIIASGDRIAADAVGLALIKHYGKAPGVAGKGVWDQLQIQRAVALGLGVKDRASILLKPANLEAGGEEFSRLLSSIHKLAGIELTPT